MLGGGVLGTAIARAAAGRGIATILLEPVVDECFGTDTARGLAFARLGQHVGSSLT